MWITSLLVSCPFTLWCSLWLDFIVPLSDPFILWPLWRTPDSTLVTWGDFSWTSPILLFPLRWHLSKSVFCVPQFSWSDSSEDSWLYGTKKDAPFPPVWLSPLLQGFPFTWLSWRTKGMSEYTPEVEWGEDKELEEELLLAEDGWL